MTTWTTTSDFRFRIFRFLPLSSAQQDPAQPPTMARDAAISAMLLRVVVLLSWCLVSSSSFTFYLPIPSRAPGFRYPISLVSPLQSMAEKVLETPKWPSEWPYKEADFSRMDENDDTVFYDSPRLVSHQLYPTSVTHSDLIIPPPGSSVTILTMPPSQR